jgi:hypothetical protein
MTRKQLLALPIIVALVLALTGCGESIQAARAIGAIEASSINYDQNRDRIDEAFIQFYRAKMIAEADALADAAVKAETKPVDGVPMANPNNLALIYAKKLDDYKTIECRIIEMRTKIIAAKQDHVNIIQYSDAMKQYFNASTSSADLLNKNTEQLLQMLEQFMPKKGGGK